VMESTLESESEPSPWTSITPIVKGGDSGIHKSIFRDETMLSCRQCPIVLAQVFDGVRAIQQITPPAPLSGIAAP
jgi:hypothetical protein